MWGEKKKEKKKEKGGVVESNTLCGIAEKGLGGKVSALQEIREKYGFEARAIVSMGEVIEHLHNKPYRGEILIDDTLKKAIDAYYAEYGA